MIHYSCDLCSRPIRPDEPRFEVKIEVRVGYGQEDGAVSPDMFDEEIEEFLDMMEEEPPSGLCDDMFRTFRYDLCQRCHAAYLNDPLSRTRRLGIRNFDN